MARPRRAAAVAYVILEVGAGSGYAAAILARLAERVHAIERNPRLAEVAGERLERLGYDNVEVRAVA